MQMLLSPHWSGANAHHLQAEALFHHMGPSLLLQWQVHSLASSQQLTIDTQDTSRVVAIMQVSGCSGGLTIFTEVCGALHTGHSQEGDKEGCRRLGYGACL